MTRSQLNFRVSAKLLDRIKAAADTQNISVTAFCLSTLELAVNNMAKNQLFGIRLNPEAIQALEEAYPGITTVEAIRAILMEHLGLESINNADNPAYSQAIETRLNAIESRLEEKLEVIDKLAEVLTAFKK